MAGDPIDCHAVENARWADLEALFEARGGPHYCWCMAWRSKPPDKDKASLKAALHQRVNDGTPIGIIGYDGNRPVAWCSIAPRPTYRRLGGPGDHESDGAVWSIVCFFIKRDMRGKGLTESLIRAAISEAQAHGAKTIEAYPVDSNSPSYGFMGRVATFERLGFKPVGKVGKWRHAMRLALA
ncbi:N-acetyltransferase family protein [Hoeflea sp.]|uniref:GNAT family N-acetyltransferase n=1 Tax=Hoeflea sp. TaxID=1940281 RepID=UPI003B01FA2E